MAFRPVDKSECTLNPGLPDVAPCALCGERRAVKVGYAPTKSRPVVGKAAELDWTRALYACGRCSAGTDPLVVQLRLRRRCEEAGHAARG